MVDTLAEAIEVCDEWWRVALEWKRRGCRLSFPAVRELLAAEEGAPDVP
jgi:hypothetical protein